MVVFKPKNHADILDVITNELEFFNKQHSTKFKSVREVLVFISIEKSNRLHSCLQDFEDYAKWRAVERTFMIMNNYLRRKNLE